MKCGGGGFVQQSDPPPPAAEAAATSPARGAVVTRFAPSPSGRLHLGHAYSAAIGHARARQTGGRFHLRIEDLDQTRCKPEFVGGIYEDLRWLGLEWDEPVLVQSERTDAYAAALDSLKARGLAYACFCTRADIAQSLTAPHGDAATSYPGTCRALPDDPERRSTTPHSWRLNSAKALALAGLPLWTEVDGTQFNARAGDIGDAILARKDAPASYHLSCVVDDAASHVTTVVRGADLRPSTPIQRLLQVLLGLPEPTYLHHALVTHEDGRRLAKRDLAPTLAAMRENGVDGPRLVEGLLEGHLPSGFRLQDA
jgi:glutamyl-Q tRNA(Asp) synthetase